MIRRDRMYGGQVTWGSIVVTTFNEKSTIPLMSTWQGFIPLFWSLWEHNKYNKTLWVRIPIPTSSPSSYCDFFDLGFQPTNLSWCWGVYALACSRLLDSEGDAKVFPPVFFCVYALSQFSGPNYLGAWNRLCTGESLEGVTLCEHKLKSWPWLFKRWIALCTG